MKVHTVLISRGLQNTAVLMMDFGAKLIGVVF